MPDLNSLLLEEYERKFELYRAFATKVETLLHDIVADKKLPVHSVSSRVKTRHSLEQKLKRPGSSYRALSDVTDLVGMRIICYFADDVDRIAALVEQQFQTDTVNTVDKRKILDPDRFGYLSLHHVVRFTPDRSALIDYSRFLDLRAEIQTRSILQHSWAEIEHDLGYKGSVEVPRHLRRRFSRVAGLLELADDEFRQIRDDLKEPTLAAEDVARRAEPRTARSRFDQRVHRERTVGARDRRADLESDGHAARRVHRRAIGPGAPGARPASGRSRPCSTCRCRTAPRRRGSGRHPGSTGTPAGTGASRRPRRTVPARSTAPGRRTAA